MSNKQPSIWKGCIIYWRWKWDKHTLSKSKVQRITDEILELGDPDKLWTNYPNIVLRREINIYRVERPHD